MRKPSRCTDELPCPDVVINFRADGELEEKFPMMEGDDAERLFRHHFMKVGISPSEIPNEGVMAMRSLKDMFNVTFPPIESFRYKHLGAGMKGLVHFRPFILDTKARLRVTTTSHKDDVQYFNKPVSYAGVM